MTETRMRILVAALLLVVGVLVGGCVQEIHTPTRTATPTTTAIVRVFTFAGHQPIADVLVTVNGTCQGATRPDGEFVVVVPLRVESTIGVSRAGYREFRAAGTVNAAGERWTFYLEEL